ncbi:hypothetical protein AVEN_255976-1 [Araneus ventricosus]|uniref:Uncharacterized protein n=1 Tax=Araneus ventricosus TaxID=182803 RepID=A0A4Y2SA06_ARAVE|nr:hypothetical protein AVEN_255976-1 [Araneus ventricosus]
MSIIEVRLATSTTEQPLPPAMREIKSNQTSTILLASSSLHPFLWRWKVPFHQFNIQLRLLFSPSSPNEFRTALSFFQDFFPRSSVFLLQIDFHQPTPLQNQTF